MSFEPDIDGAPIEKVFERLKTVTAQRDAAVKALKRHLSQLEFVEVKFLKDAIKASTDQ